MADTPAAYAITRTYFHGEAKMREAALHLIGSGTGCDCRINGEEPDRSFYERMRIFDRLHRAKTREAKKMWGLS